MKTWSFFLNLNPPQIKQILSLLKFISMTRSVIAQDAIVKDLKNSATTTLPSVDTSKKANKRGWIKGGFLNINVSQVSNSNWIASGGDKFSLAMGGSLNLFANRKWKRNTWENTLH